MFLNDLWLENSRLPAKGLFWHDILAGNKICQ